MINTSFFLYLPFSSNVYSNKLLWRQPRPPRSSARFPDRLTFTQMSRNSRHPSQPTAWGKFCRLAPASLSHLTRSPRLPPLIVTCQRLSGESKIIQTTQDQRKFLPRHPDLPSTLKVTSHQRLVLERVTTTQINSSHAKMCPQSLPARWNLRDTSTNSRG